MCPNLIRPQAKRNQRKVGRRGIVLPLEVGSLRFLDVPGRSVVCIRLSAVYRASRLAVDRKREWKQVAEEHSVHVIVLPAKNFIGGTLSLCIFMLRMLLPAFRRLPVQCYTRMPISRGSDTLEHAHDHMNTGRRGNASRVQAAHQAKCRHFAKASCGFRDITSHAAAASLSRHVPTPCYARPEPKRRE